MPVFGRIATDLPVAIKSASYPLELDDFGREIQFDSATAVNAELPSIDDAGNGYNVIIRNSGSGTLTILPDGLEKIDDESSALLSTGDWRWIRSDETEWKSVARSESGGALNSMQFITSDETWMRPSGVTKIKVTVVGGGGGGGGARSSQDMGSTGGGGGGAAIKIIDVSSIPSVDVTIGMGGSGGAAGEKDGSVGGDTEFGLLFSATGGDPGRYARSPATAITINGGIGLGGDLNIQGGGAGGFSRGSTGPRFSGGIGGSSILGGGGGSAVGDVVNGSAGGNYGGGGAGGMADLDVPADNKATGGDGADGVVVIESYS